MLLLIRAGYRTSVLSQHRPKCFGSTKYQNMPHLSVPSFGPLRLITWSRSDNAAADWLYRYTWLWHAGKIHTWFPYVCFYGYAHRWGSHVCVVNCSCVCRRKGWKMSPWLHFSKIDANRAWCNTCKKVIVAKASNRINLMKHLTVHGTNLRAERCSVFDCKKSGPQPSSSQHLK